MSHSSALSLGFEGRCEAVSALQRSSQYLWDEKVYGLGKRSTGSETPMLAQFRGRELKEQELAIKTQQPKL